MFWMSTRERKKREREEKVRKEKVGLRTIF